MASKRLQRGYREAGPGGGGEYDTDIISFTETGKGPKLVGELLCTVINIYIYINIHF